MQILQSINSRLQCIQHSQSVCVLTINHPPEPQPINPDLEDLMGWTGISEKCLGDSNLWFFRPHFKKQRDKDKQTIFKALLRATFKYLEFVFGALNLIHY